jgi:hypothetical protein
MVIMERFFRAASVVHTIAVLAYHNFLMAHDFLLAVGTPLSIDVETY